MAIPPLEQRLNDMVSTPGEPALEPSIDATPQPGLPAVAQEELPEDVQVAGLVSGGLSLLEGLTKSGARAAKKPKLVDEVIKAAPPPAAAGATPIAPVTTPKAPAPVKPAAPQLRPVDITTVNDIAAERAMLEAAGAGQAAPPATPISSAWTDNDGLAATIRAAGDNFAEQAPSMSLRSIYTQAINAGVPEKFLERALAGESMDATVGGSQLAKQLAGAVVVHDESAKKLDDLFTKMKDGTLDDQGKLDLRLALAQHKIIVEQLKGIQTDVARSLNVFKRVKDKGPGLDTRDVRAALDELGADQSDRVLYQLAVDYLETPTRKGKNALIEVGLGAKIRDIWFHTFQAHLLNDPATHAYNLAGSGVFGALQPLERALATGIGRIRTAIPGTDPDRYQMGDIMATLSGLKNGMLDGWELAKEAIKRGGESKFTETNRPLNPLSAEYLSDTPIRLFGREVYRTPDLRDSWVGRAIEGLGFVQDIMSFRPIAAADEFVGGIVARMQLHQEAWTYLNKEYDRLIAAGMDPAAARAEVQAKGAQLLTERPRAMQENIDSLRDMVTLQTKIDRQGVLGETYYWSNQILNLAPIKMIVPFAKTVTNLFIEGSSYIPVLNAVSPRFYDLWSKGGRHRDVAIARLSMGGSAITGSAMLALDNRVTGSGPSQTEDRQALERLGWQKYSLVFDKGEISEENIERLRAITKVSVGSDKIYVSYARFDPVSMVFAMGADMADAAKFDRHPGMEDWQRMALAGMTATGEYMANLPMLQAIGELLSIARSRSTDTGEKLVQVFDGLARQYTNFVYTGTPGVGFTNSTLMGHIERLVDPTRSNVKAAEMDVPAGLRAFYETKQRIMSRIPGVSADVPPLLDELGREVKVDTRGLDNWLNWSPVIQAREGKRSEVDEVLVALDYGIPRASETWDGVRLSAQQINRFKRLAGQEILMDGMNLEQAIPFELAAAEQDALVAGQPLLKGDKQKMIAAIVERYRSAAKAQMVGDPEGIMPAVEFPDLAAAMRRNREIARTYGR
jgi:hypothetical protein